MRDEIRNIARREKDKDSYFKWILKLDGFVSEIKGKTQKDTFCEVQRKY